MPIVKIIKRDTPFCIIDSRGLHDERLSWKAKGLLAYLISKPDDWQVIIADLLNRGTDGKRSVRAGLLELRKQGYAHFGPARDTTGAFIGTQWTVYEHPSERPLIKKLAVSAESAVLRTSAFCDAPETRRSAKCATTKNDSLTKIDSHTGDFLKRLGTLFEREEGWKLSHRESRSWNRIKLTVTEEEVALVEKFHRKCRRAERPPMPRQSLQALLDDWNGECDRARVLWPKRKAVAKAAPIVRAAEPIAGPMMSKAERDAAKKAAGLSR